MARDPLSRFFARLRPPPGLGGDGATDADLLRRWADARDPAALELLVWRHGALVLGTCRRVCRREADAADAFQATFLMLARSAGDVRSSLPGWLHRAARRAALRASRRRREVLLNADVPATASVTPDADELAQLDAAVNGLGSGTAGSSCSATCKATRPRPRPPPWACPSAPSTRASRPPAAAWPRT